MNDCTKHLERHSRAGGIFTVRSGGDGGERAGWSFELVSHLLPPYPRSLGAAYSLVLPSPQLLHLENKGATPTSPAPFLYLGLTFSWERSCKSENSWKSETTCGPSIPVWALPCFVWRVDVM